MGSEWQTEALGDFISIITGFPFKSAVYTANDNGIRLLRGDNVVQNAFRWENVKRWPQSEIIEKHQAYWLKEDDVILAMDRPWIDAGLKTSQVSSSDLPCLLVQRVACLRTKKGMDQNFLKYVISSRTFTDYVKLIQTGTAVPHISSKQIAGFTFNLPDQSTQIQIGKILRSLDDKIELNRRMNETLESMARALFKSWFVDFDPVIDNALAAGNPIPEPLGARAETRRALGTQRKPIPNNIQKLFPDAFVFDEEMGWIPEGWQVKKWGDIATLQYGKSLKGYRD